MRTTSFAKVRNTIVSVLCSLTLLIGLCPAVALAEESVADTELTAQSYDAGSKYSATLVHPSQAIVNQTFDVWLNASTSNSSTDPLSCMQVTIKYDPTKVSLGESNIAINSSLDRGDCTDNGNGTVIITFYGNTYSSVDAATLTFTGLKAGNPGIKISDAIAGASGQIDDKGVKFSQTKLNMKILFSDVTDSSKFYFSSVYAAVSRNIINGYANGTFGPNDTLTRAQAAVILWGAYGKPSYGTTNTTGMPDVADGAFYTAAATWAVDKGIINGVKTSSGPKFSPNGKITLQDLCVIIANAASKLNGITTSGADRTKLNSKSDAGTVSAYAVNAVAWSLNNGIINGKGNLIAPLDKVTRGEMATITMNAISKGFIG